MKRTMKNRKKRESKAETAPLRRAFGGFVAGAAAATAIDAKNRLRGMTANPFASVSMNPPLVPARIGQLAMHHDQFDATGGFAINILSAGRPTRRK